MCTGIPRKSSFNAGAFVPALSEERSLQEDRLTELFIEFHKNWEESQKNRAEF